MRLKWIAAVAVTALLAPGAFLVFDATKRPSVAQLQAQTPTMNNGRAAYHVPHTNYDHPAGVEMLYLEFDGVQFTDAAEKPLDRAHQVCHATCRVATLGAQCMGYCSAVDDDGDVAWITWDRKDDTGGSWEYLGGTGKYEGETGGGTWTVGGEHGPSMVSNFWARTH